MSRFDFVFSILWNIILITTGAVIFAFGIRAVAVDHGLVAGGIFGLSLLINYLTNTLTPNIWYFIINIPIFIVGILFVSKRFFFYSLYAVLAITMSYWVLDFHLLIENQMYAAIAAGAICGLGTGMILRSLGSAGGLDVIAIILNRYFNIGIGKFYFAFNVFLFTLCLVFLEIDLVIASLILVFVSSVAVDYVLSLFSNRKVVYIVSESNKEISEDVIFKMKHGATFIKARGAYSGREKDILMVVTHCILLKRLEEIVFSIDPEALFIVGDTFAVIGSSFSKRKVY